MTPSPTRRSSDLAFLRQRLQHLLSEVDDDALTPFAVGDAFAQLYAFGARSRDTQYRMAAGDTLGAETSIDKARSEEHTSELQSRPHLVCRLLLDKKDDPDPPCRIQSESSFPTQSPFATGRLAIVISCRRPQRHVANGVRDALVRDEVDLRRELVL